MNNHRLIVDRLCYAANGQEIINDVSFSIQSGQVCCLVGSSGCGKTTLLKLISALLVPKSGCIYLDHHSMTRQSNRSRPNHHPAAMVFQDLGLFPHMTVAKNVAYGLKTKHNSRQAVNDILQQMRLDGLESRYPHELSIGQQQRVALARTLILEPKIMLLDEPFSNLDSGLRLSLAEEVFTLLREKNIITILVTHDRDDALSLGDYVAVMDEGQILQWGEPKKLIYQPDHPAVARYMGFNALIKGVVETHNQVRTELGVFRIDNTGQRLQVGAPVKVLLRHSDICIESSTSDTRTEVVYRNFEAENLIYTLRLPNNEKVFAKAHSRPFLRLGDHTQIQTIVPSVRVFPIHSNTMPLTSQLPDYTSVAKEPKFYPVGI